LTEPIRYGVISDTHGQLPARVHEAFKGVKNIFHCGDIGSRAVFDELGTIAPVTAVSGNMDSWPLSRLAPDQAIEVAEFGLLAMTHGTRHGHDSRRIAKGLLQEFARQNPRLILFGHSHEAFIKQFGDILIVNPGSTTLPTHDDPPSVVVLTFDPEADTLEAEFVAL